MPPSSTAPRTISPSLSRLCKDLCALSHSFSLSVVLSRALPKRATPREIQERARRCRGRGASSTTRYSRCSKIPPPRTARRTCERSVSPDSVRIKSESESKRERERTCEERVLELGVVVLRERGAESGLRPEEDEKGEEDARGEWCRSRRRGRICARRRRELLVSARSRPREPGVDIVSLSIDAPLHLADDVAPLEVLHAVVQRDVVVLVVVALCEDPLLGRVGPGRVRGRSGSAHGLLTAGGRGRAGRTRRASR